MPRSRSRSHSQSLKVNTWLQVKWVLRATAAITTRAVTMPTIIRTLTTTITSIAADGQWLSTTRRKEAGSQAKLAITRNHTAKVVISTTLELQPSTTSQSRTSIIKTLEE